MASVSNSERRRIQPIVTGISAEETAIARSVTERALRSPAFQALERVFTLGDILEAARLRGDLEAFRSEWRDRQARVSSAVAAELNPAPEAIDAGTDAFRYARDLVSAEECDRWLGQRGLTFPDLNGCIVRRLQAELADPDPAYVPKADDDNLCMIDALLADDFTIWARRLARRVALTIEATRTFPATASLAALWPELEARVQAAVAELSTPDRRKRALVTQRLSLMRITLVAAEFDTEHAAREARLCVLEDKISLADTAAANGFLCEKIEAFLDEFPEGWQQPLLSARSGDVISAPNDGSGRIRVLQLLRRREPTLDQKRVRERVDASLVEQRLSELETRHIRWKINVELEK